MPNCCPLVYFCANGQVVSGEPGAPPPAGAVGDPYESLEEAETGCPYLVAGCSPPLAIQGNLSGYTISLVNKTGSAVAFPNSVLCKLRQQGVNSRTYDIPGSGGCINIWCPTILLVFQAGGIQAYITFGQINYDIAIQTTGSTVSSPWNILYDDSFISTFSCQSWDNFAAPSLVANMVTRDVNTLAITGGVDLWISK